MQHHSIASHYHTGLIWPQVFRLAVWHVYPGNNVNIMRMVIESLIDEWKSYLLNKTGQELDNSPQRIFL